MPLFKNYYEDLSEGYRELEARIIEMEKNFATQMSRAKDNYHEKVEDLTEHLHSFQEFIDLFPEIIYEIDTKGNLTFINKTALQEFGFTEEEYLKGINIMNIFVPEDRDRLKGRIQLFYEGKIESKGSHYTALKKDGSTFPVLVYNQLIKFNNEPIGARGIMVNITEQKSKELKLKIAKDIAEQICEVAPSAIYSVDKNKIIKTWNKKAEELTGYTANEVIGKSCSIFSEHPCKEICSLFESNVSKPIEDKECTIRRKDGDLRIISKNINYLYDSNENIIGGIESFEDVTERRIAMLELIKARDRAEESDKLKSAFLANMSHEIRTPINGILGFAELLRDKKINDNDREEFLDIIRQNGKQLLTLINDILDISKIEANQLVLRRESFSISLLTEEIFNQFSKEIRSNKEGIKFELIKDTDFEEQEIFSDSLRIKQVLTNLLTNAMKFTDSGRIEFGYKALHNSKIEFFVKDTGIGIQKELQQNIFNRFYQIDGSDKKALRGTGLGLAISKGLVEILGGKIWVQSKIGEGSTFFFTIPITQVEINRSVIRNNYEDETEYRWDNKVLLLVEDDNINYKYLEILLKRTNIEVLRASDGESAVELCQKRTDIDIVLMDIQLPKINGYDATKIIRSFNPKLPVIAQTANAMNEDMEKCFEAGCNAYITKPIDKRTLFNTMNEYLKAKVVPSHN